MKLSKLDKDAKKSIDGLIKAIVNVYRAKGMEVEAIDQWKPSRTWLVSRLEGEFEMSTLHANTIADNVLLVLLGFYSSHQDPMDDEF